MAKKKEAAEVDVTIEAKVPETAKKEVVKEPKLKVKMNKFAADKEIVTKVDLSKQAEETKEVEEVVSAEVEDTAVEETVVENTEVEDTEVEDTTIEETAVVEEITNEEIDAVVPTKEEVVEAIAESKEQGIELPDNIKKAVEFINETGGSLEDYVGLNRDYSDLDDISLLKEYYKKTKSHLDSDEIDFLIEDSFEIDEDIDEDRDIKKKKIALKEQVASAKNHLDGLKSKYYEEIKAGSKLAPEQQKAVDFFNRYTKEAEENQEVAKVQASTFQQETNKVFNDSFKGFEYDIGDKKFRFNVKDVSKVKENQSSIDNFVKKFLDKKNTLSDAKGYHKSIFTATNPDAVANHFYEQGKADAIKDSIAKSKNLSMDPRQTNSNVIQSGGMKVRAVPGDSAADFKFKIKRK